MARTEFPDLRPEDLLRMTEIDLEGLPPVMTTKQLALALGMSADALAQDRYRQDGNGIPFTRIGRRIRYLRSDVIHHLISHRCA
jgi:hypothetical protein